MQGLAVLLLLGVISIPIMQIALLVKMAGFGERLKMMESCLRRLREMVEDLSDGDLEPAPVRQLDKTPEKPEVPAPSVERTATEPVKPIVLKAPKPPARPLVHPEPERPERVEEKSTLEVAQAEADKLVKTIGDAGRQSTEVNSVPLEPTPVELFFKRIGDWLAVSGEFAPKGMSREFAFATRWLVRLGILLLVASVAYFMKLSIDRGWVGPAQRVAGTVMFGGAMSVFGAWVVRKTRYGVVGHALAAIGFASLYLGFGLGHRFFDPPVIASAPLAFGALAAVTVFGAVMAVALDSPVIAVLSLVAGYLVPVIAGKDSGSPVALDVYLAMLNVGVFVVARIRRWSVLDFLAAAGAYAVCLIWCSRHMPLSNAHVVVNLSFLAFVHFLYMASVLFSSKHRSQAGNSIAWAGLAINACMFASWTAYLVNENFGRQGAGVVLLALTAAYVVIAAMSIRRGWADRACINIALFFALAFLWVSPMLLVGEMWLAPCWCLIAIACVKGAQTSNQPLLRHLGWFVLLSACVMSLHNMATGYVDHPLQPWSGTSQWARTMGLNLVRIGVMPATFAYLGWQEWKARAGESWKMLASLSVITLFLYITGEAWNFTMAFLPTLRSGGVTVAWGVFAFVMLIVGIVKRVKGLRMVGLVVLAITVGKLLLVDTSHLDMPWRVALCALTGVMLMLGAVLYIKFQKEFADEK